LITGSCLCGTVRFEVDGRVTPIQFCHCPRCRRTTGSAFFAQLAARTGDFRFVAGADEVAVWSAPVREEPPPYRRTFCRVCGSPVPVFDSEEPFVAIPAGSLDGDPGTRPFRHIFVAMKAPWHEIQDDLPRLPMRVPPDQRLPSKRH
jgi:hypothetical protein